MSRLRDDVAGAALPARWRRRSDPCTAPRQPVLGLRLRDARRRGIASRSARSAPTRVVRRRSGVLEPTPAVEPDEVEPLPAARRPGRRTAATRRCRVRPDRPVEQQRSIFGPSPSVAERRATRSARPAPRSPAAPRCAHSRTSGPRRRRAARPRREVGARPQSTAVRRSAAAPERVAPARERGTRGRLGHAAITPRRRSRGGPASASISCGRALASIPAWPTGEVPVSRRPGTRSGRPRRRDPLRGIHEVARGATPPMDFRSTTARGTCGWPRARSPPRRRPRATRGVDHGGCPECDAEGVGLAASPI